MVRFLRRRRSRDRKEKNESSSANDNAEASSSSSPNNSSTPKSETTQSSTATLRFSGPAPPKSRFSEGSSIGNRRNRPLSDIELLKQRFSKLLLGEDMSGGGIGVSSALAISNAITNLAASILGEQRRLEPMEAETKERWWREINWLLSVTDFIVEFVPKQVSKDGTSMEVMITEQRKDLRKHIPALRTIDKILIECLDAYKDQNEFWYASSNDKNGNSARREGDKWWIPTVEVPADGLSEGSRKWIRYQKELVREVLGEAMDINADVLANMDIPESYLESLPKKGKSSLGESLYKSMKDDDFVVDEFLSSQDLSTEHKTLDLKNRIEASLVIMRRKMSSKSQRSSAASMEKMEKFEERAELILLILKHRFPALPQSDLDVSKIQRNRDVGHAIVESYSRIIESRASTILSRIEDVLYADSLAVAAAAADGRTLSDTELMEVEKMEVIDTSRVTIPEDLKEDDTAALRVEMKVNAEGSERWMKKLPNIVGRKKSYLEKIESCEEPRSPESRH